MKQMAADNGRTNDEIHQCIGQNIENRTCRTDPKHKFADTGSIPFSGLGQKLFVHIIPGNRRTGDIVNQIQQNQMYRRHRQEGQKSTGDQNRKNITKIRRSRHLDIFNHISIGFTAFKNTLFQNQQIFFQ